MNNIEKLKLNKKIDYLEFFIYIVSAIIYSVTSIAIPLYLSFLYTFFTGIINYHISKNIFFIIKIFIFSIIIPNNYLIIALTIFFTFFNLKKVKKGIYFILFSMFLIFNIAINEVNILNLSFGLFYLVPVLLTFLFLDIYKNTLFSKKQEISNIIKKIIIIETISNLFFFIFHFHWIATESANDWFSGTFGFHQGNIFLYFMLFSLLILLEEYEKTKKLEDLIFCVICLISALLTNSIALILLFFFSFFIITISKSNLRKKLKTLGFVAITIALFLLVTPAWIKEYILKLTDYNYFVKTVAKVQVYEDTFINIPKNDVKFFIFGSGIGQYSSRAALTCTGRYIESYNKIFSPSVSAYTQKYILGRYIRYNIIEGQGTLYSPFSTIITIQGEYGIFGMVIFLVLLVKIWQNSSKNSKIFILFFLLSCLIENYLEFGKIMFMFFLIYFLNLEKNQEREYVQIMESEKYE